MSLYGSDPFEGIPEEPPGVPEQVRRVLSEDFSRRLQRSESEVAMSTAVEREGLCDWLGAMLHRPPLERPTPAWRPMRALVEALWWDLSDRTPDLTEPLALSPRILANHPWGEGEDA